MSMNRFMHPRNPYKNKPPDFKHLALECPAFRAIAQQDVSGKVTVDFKNPETLRALTCALLKVDFGLEVTFPPARLIPAVPQRLNYLLWIEDVLESLPNEEVIYGVDIGTGSSCILPLLGKKKFGWNFVCSEVDKSNFDSAVQNVQCNQLNSSIDVHMVTPDEGILTQLLKKTDKDTFHFCVCNPPFFGVEHATTDGSEGHHQSDSSKELSRRRKGDHIVESSSGSAVERHIEGGEVSFIKKMVDDSLIIRDKVSVYSSMVGRKCDLPPIKQYLRDKGISNIASTEFCQGKTMRWAIGWTFDPKVQFPVSEFKKKRKTEKPPISFTISGSKTPCSKNMEESAVLVKSLLRELQITATTVCDNNKELVMSCVAHTNTWSHQRRKRRQRERTTSASTSQEHPASGEQPQGEKMKKSDSTTGKVNNCENPAVEMRTCVNGATIPCLTPSASVVSAYSLEALSNETENSTRTGTQSLGTHRETVTEDRLNGKVLSLSSSSSSSQYKETKGREASSAMETNIAALTNQSNGKRAHVLDGNEIVGSPLKQFRASSDSSSAIRCVEKDNNGLKHVYAFALVKDVNMNEKVNGDSCNCVPCKESAEICAQNGSSAEKCTPITVRNDLSHSGRGDASTVCDETVLCSKGSCAEKVEQCVAISSERDPESKFSGNIACTSAPTVALVNQDTGSSEPILVFMLSLRSQPQYSGQGEQIEDGIVLQVKWVGGTTRDTLFQVMQFFKNNFSHTS